jgi:hypothetical protein
MVVLILIQYTAVYLRAVEELVCNIIEIFCNPDGTLKPADSRPKAISDPVREMIKSSVQIDDPSNPGQLIPRDILGGNGAPGAHGEIRSLK